MYTHLCLILAGISLYVANELAVLEQVCFKIIVLVLFTFTLNCQLSQKALKLFKLFCNQSLVSDIKRRSSANRRELIFEETNDTGSEFLFRTL